MTGSTLIGRGITGRGQILIHLKIYKRFHQVGVLITSEAHLLGREVISTIQMDTDQIQLYGLAEVREWVSIYKEYTQIMFTHI